jgi:hypothetical protein
VKRSRAEIWFRQARPLKKSRITDQPLKGGRFCEQTVADTPSRRSPVIKASH